MAISQHGTIHYGNPLVHISPVAVVDDRDLGASLARPRRRPAAPGRDQRPGLADCDSTPLDGGAPVPGGVRDADMRDRRHRHRDHRLATAPGGVRRRSHAALSSGGRAVSSSARRGGDPRKRDEIERDLRALVPGDEVAQKPGRFDRFQ
jgi:hypothetical protein